MSDINKVTKTDYNALKIDYTSRDYTTILDDLINSIPGITDKWQTTDQNDPGMVLVKLIAMLGDMLNYQQDIQSLEVYPNTVTQRKNASSIYKLIGYKMKWYRSAKLTANVVNTYSSQATIPRFCTFATENNDIVYTTFDYYDLMSNMTNNGNETAVELIQGTPVTPVRSSNNPYPEVGKEWHSIYGYNYTVDNIVNNRIYLNDTNIDQDHIIMIDDNGNEWELKDNIYLTTHVGRFFEFDVDVNDKPYLELVDYYTNFNVHKFKIFYIKSLGEAGQIYSNTLKKITGNVWSRTSTSNGTTTYNVSNFINFIHDDSSFGYDPETPDEARKESVKYLNTLDTLITLADFERATLREPGVANVRATDLTNDPGMKVSCYIGDINQDGVIDEKDEKVLSNYLADPTKYPLSDYAWKLADINQDGSVTVEDLKCIRNYLNGDKDHSGQCGIMQINNINQLSSFVVKLYILLTEDYANALSEESAKESYKNDIVNALEEHKILPLTIQVDLDSIHKYYWTIKGKFYTTEPLTRDELQTLMVNINSKLKFQYSLTKVNFNTVVNYKDIIETIMGIDKRILMVDLDPITYEDEEGNTIDKQDLICAYTKTIKKLDNKDDADNLLYKFTLENNPILPGSVMIRLNNGQFILRDNNNGQIYNSDGLLAKNGKINYLTGEMELEFTSPLADDIIIDYTKNEVNIATYKNLSTQTFYFDSSSLKQETTNLI